MAREVAQLLNSRKPIGQSSPDDFSKLHGEPDEGVEAAWADEVERRVRKTLAPSP